MKTRIAISLVLLALMGIFSLAQEHQIRAIAPGEDNPTGGWYVFSGDDVPRVNALWHVVGPRWREALDHPNNGNIKATWRESQRQGMTYYFVQKEEQFFVPPGMRAKVFLIAEAERVSEEKGGSGVNPPPAPSINAGLYTLGFILGLLIFLLFWRLNVLRKRAEAKMYQGQMQAEAEQARRNDPEGSGPPIVPGGMNSIPAEFQVDIATEHLQNIAARTFVPNSKPRDYHVVGDVVRGTLDGEGFVEYNDGKPKVRVFNATPAFRALMEHIPTGQRIYRYALWACVNGAYSNLAGGESLTFTPTIDQNGLQVRLAPVLSATAEEISKYGTAEYDARHDSVALLLGRPETVEHAAASMPRRARVFMSSVR